MTFMYDFGNALWKALLVFVSSYSMLTWCHICKNMVRRIRVIEVKILIYLFVFTVLYITVVFTVHMANIGDMVLYNLLINN